MFNILNHAQDSKSISAFRRFEEEISWEGDRQLYDLTKLFKDFYLYQINDTVIIPLFSLQSIIAPHYLHKTRLAIARIYLEESGIEYKSIIVLYADQVPSEKVEQIILNCAPEKVTPWFLIPENKIDYSFAITSMMDGVDWKRTIEHFDPGAAENKVIMEWD